MDTRKKIRPPSILNFRMLNFHNLDSFWKLAKNFLVLIHAGHNLPAASYEAARSSKLSQIF
jgi:hypothetical protein